MIDRNDLADVLATDDLDLPKKAAQRGISDLLDAIGAGLARGEEIALPDIGKLIVEPTPERPGRNPRTGEAITIAAGHRVKFRAFKALKDRLAAA